MLNIRNETKDHCLVWIRKRLKRASVFGFWIPFMTNPRNLHESKFHQFLLEMTFPAFVQFGFCFLLALTSFLGCTVPHFCNYLWQIELQIHLALCSDYHFFMLTWQTTIIIYYYFFTYYAFQLWIFKKVWSLKRNL